MNKKNVTKDNLSGIVHCAKLKKRKNLSASFAVPNESLKGASGNQLELPMPMQCNHLDSDGSALP